MIISRSCLIAADVILILITWISLWKRVVHVSGRPTRLPFTKVLLWDGACIVRVCTIMRQPRPELPGTSDSVAHADRCHFPQGPRISCAYALSICHLDAFPSADILLSVLAV